MTNVGNDGQLGSTPDGDNNDPGWTTGISGTALEFDGVDDQVTVPKNVYWDFDTDESFSISFWLKFHELIGTYQIINFGGDYHLELEFGEPLGQLSFSIPNTENSAWINDGDGTQASKTDWKVGQWYHIALVRVVSISPTIKPVALVRAALKGHLAGGLNDNLLRVYFGELRILVHARVEESRDLFIDIVDGV